jgi:hypothetical protein
MNLETRDDEQTSSVSDRMDDLFVEVEARDDSVLERTVTWQRAAKFGVRSFLYGFLLLSLGQRFGWSPGLVYTMLITGIVIDGQAKTWPERVPLFFGAISAVSVVGLYAEAIRFGPEDRTRLVTFIVATGLLALWLADDAFATMRRRLAKKK